MKSKPVCSGSYFSQEAAEGNAFPCPLCLKDFAEEDFRITRSLSSDDWPEDFYCLSCADKIDGDNTASL
jgi:hypothetical protein